MEQQHQENDDSKCGLWSRSAMSNSMEGISDFLKALSEDFDDVVAPPLPSVPVDDHRQVATADSSNKDVVVGGSDEDEKEHHLVKRGNHCQTRSGAGSSAGIRTEKRGFRDHARHRTTEMHNFTERKRREKIKWKLGELQQLVPNSNNMDRASMLEEAIRYMKSLQQEVKALSTSRLGVLCQTPYRQPLQAVQCMRLTSYPQFIPMNMNMDAGMNMVGMNCTMAPLEPTRPTPPPSSTGMLPIVPAQPIRFFAPPAFQQASVPSPAEISKKG